MRTRSSILAVLLTAACAAVSALAPSAAFAARPDVDGSGTKLQVAMERIGVDHQVAAANGYEVHVDSNGVEYPVKKGSKSRVIVAGNCGNAWVWITAVDTRRHYTKIITGFDLHANRAGAYRVEWNLAIVDNFGVSFKEDTDWAAGVHFWQIGYDFTASGPTPVRSNIVSGRALLLDGSICLAGGAWATGRL